MPACFLDAHILESIRERLNFAVVTFNLDIMKKIIVITLIINRMFVNFHRFGPQTSAKPMEFL